MSSADAAGTVAGWLSFFVTAAGLGSLITQTNAIEERLDPFRNARGEEYLGNWVFRQPPRPYFRLRRPPPVGPVIVADLPKGFCNSNIISVSRLPLENAGTASWTALLAIFHERSTSLLPRPKYRRTSTLRWRTESGTTEDVFKGSHHDSVDIEKGHIRISPSWTSLPLQPLAREGSSSGIIISCATLITILSVCNAFKNFHFSDASGLRSSFASYSGIWYINWPIGQQAVVWLAPHVSHSLTTDVYPRTFLRRVDRCIRMTAGVITSPDGKSFQCGFSVRQAPGEWILQYQRKGYSGARGSRHLYYLMGGKVSEVDYLFAKKLAEDPPPGSLRLSLPSHETNVRLTLFVPEDEKRILDHALDCLPWSSLPWSVHRGLRDILLGYAQPTMNRYRKTLASRLYEAVARNPHRLQTAGWAPEFVDESMADIAFHSIMAGEGNSGDAVRVVTDVALLHCASSSMLDLDETDFWRQERYGMGANSDLSTNALIALTKLFILEWSTEFNYQMYLDLPPLLLMK